MDEDQLSRGFGHTHVGRREANEDSFLVDDDHGIYAVADGMGGYDGGEIASRIVVERLASFFARTDPEEVGSFTTKTQPQRPVVEERLRMAIRQANMEIQRQRVGKLHRMGSTVAAVHIREGQALVAHVGDSRVYRLRGGDLRAMTTDHSVYTEMVESGVAAPSAVGYRHMITRAVGVPGTCKPEISISSVQPSDVFLICSDGLSDVMSDLELVDVLDAVAPENAARTLVSRAFMRGADDNITAVVVLC